MQPRDSNTSSNKRPLNITFRPSVHLYVRYSLALIAPQNTRFYALIDSVIRDLLLWSIMHTLYVCYFCVIWEWFINMYIHMYICMCLCSYYVCCQCKLLCVGVFALCIFVCLLWWCIFELFQARMYPRRVSFKLCPDFLMHMISISGLFYVGPSERPFWALN